ncbi:MAG: hypothetical protein BGO45_04760 [Microbacterium sp. 71-36]|uniref:hypothetical protein n=1 Tax=unclassified Microbacterium TaxID=2609290 RepID=UPI0008696E03|nr:MULTISPECIES: hypothetical protein [unclassified Microbacterium]MBN9210537.1 hypothetical protein [Microbacterium sp.]ODT43190.1 MAG: hypothetical protein ABS60_00110 [Microbacterium sp. SCN 71-17]OJV75810.1 MAG: hypothetical protein BGO45_04760 [Microbacterium sp. 71-36]
MSADTIAEHPGHCPECGAPIRPGERIVRGNAFEAWRHAACPRTKFDFDPDTVCPDCFTVRATTGACACP